MFGPIYEIARFTGVLENEDRRPLHGVADDAARHAAAEVDDLDAAIIGSDQGALGGSHGHQEFTLSILSIDLDRSGKA